MLWPPTSTIIKMWEFLQKYSIKNHYLSRKQLNSYPQRLNSPSAALPAAGRLVLISRNVCANGIVMLESVELRRTRFGPGLTERWTKKNHLMCS